MLVIRPPADFAWLPPITFTPFFQDP